MCLNTAVIFVSSFEIKKVYQLLFASTLLHDKVFWMQWQEFI